MTIRLPLFLSFLVLTFCVSAAEEVPVTAAQFKTSFESLELPGGEDMGFVGGQFLYEVLPGLSLGPSAYGALTGERGGFITLGGAADYSLPLTDRLSINTGYFVGAGGGRGGFTLSGGGLMLRSHLGLEYSLGELGLLGFGISNQDFPNGSINSTQPYLTYSYPFSTLLSHGWSSPTLGGMLSSDVSGSEQDFSVVYRYYDVPSSVKRDDGSAQFSEIGLVGAEWTNYLDERRFIKLESEGAMGGQSNGYMQIFLGAGYRHPIADSTSLKGSLSIGVAGGGGVDTGGGLLIDSQASIQHMLTDSLFVELGAGYVMAPQASFQAVSLLGKVGYKFATPEAHGSYVKASNLRGYQYQPLRIRAVNQSYLEAAPDWRSHHADQNVDNLGVQLDYFANKNIYLTGQGIAAYQGDAGAYMAGLVGVGVHIPLSGSEFYLEGEGLAGAAGGGGLAVGSGLVWQANASLGYELTDSLSLSFGVGRLEAVDGPLKADVVSLGLAYKFGVPTAGVKSYSTLNKQAPSRSSIHNSKSSDRVLDVTGVNTHAASKVETLRVENPAKVYWPQALLSTHNSLMETSSSDVRTREYEIIEAGHSMHMIRLPAKKLERVDDVFNAKILPSRNVHYVTDSVTREPYISFGLDNQVWLGGGLNSDVTFAMRYPISTDFDISSKVSYSLLDGRDVADAKPVAGLDAIKTDYYRLDEPHQFNLDHLYLESRGTSNRYLHHNLKLGLLEEEFTGVGAEFLYWPYQSRLAMGLSGGFVEGRSPNKVFGLNGVNAFTGFGSLYWATPFSNLDAALHLGRFLAGDVGGSLDLRYTLSSGWMAGLTLSQSNSSSNKADESLGLFLRIPFDVYGSGHFVQSRYDINVSKAPSDAGAVLESVGNTLWWDLREARFDVFRGK
jgi:hypothetical protein